MTAVKKTAEKTMTAKNARTKKTTKTATKKKATKVTEEQIRARAYEIYEERGNHRGLDVDHWIQAEKELLKKNDDLKGIQRFSELVK